MSAINRHPSIQITVPFVYEATVIKARCRNPSQVFVRDEVTISIPEVAELPVAASWEDNDYETTPYKSYTLYFANQSFWIDLVASNGRQQVSVAEFVAMTRNPAARWNPFGDHPRAAYRNAQRRFEELPYRADLLPQIRQWLHDERDDAVRHLNQTAQDYLSSNGHVYLKSHEYVYHVMTFGLGNNHAGIGTILNLASRPEAERLCPETSIFSLNDLDAAIAHATEVANRRGDTNSLPIIPDHRAKVSMPQVFTFPRKIA